MLEIRDLVVSYGRVQAVQGVSLAAQPGRITLVLGANGAGKSTILRTVCGLVKPAAGSITLNDRSLVGLPAHRVVESGIAMVPEGRMIFAPLTVEENLRLGGYTASVAAAAQTLERVYEMFPILATRRRGQAGLLSGGEQQMLAFGRAMMSQPKVMLMDEPSMGLAPAVVESVLATAREIADTGIAILMVEQNADVGLTVADTVTVMERGEVVHSGDVGNAASHASAVRAFLGEAALTAAPTGAVRSSEEAEAEAESRGRKTGG
jgi:branched-chain amino acid transport system ATP-binding protein